jgi:23S rRNA (uracil1939-C5)-methyltransferase
MKRGDEITVEVEDVAFEGKSLGRVDGMVVFVPSAIPGDNVRVRLRKVKPQYAEAELLEIQVPSSLRVPPNCKYFGVCGGCRWQHMDYPAQTEFKRRHVAEILGRIGGFRNLTVKSTIGAQDSYFYRNKMEFSFGDRWLAQEEFDQRKLAGLSSEVSAAFGLGLHLPQRFDKVLDIGECWLLSIESNVIVNTVRSFAGEHRLSAYSTRTHTGYLRNLVIREGKRTGETMVNLVTSEDRPEVMKGLCEKLLAEIPSITTIVNNITTRKSQVAIGEYEQVYHGTGYITERLGNKTFRISANSFFQTNTTQAERLYDVAKRMAQLRPSDVVFDLYCGTGTIALFIADAVTEVVGIEVVESAAIDARRNAELNGVTNCRFVLGDLKEKLTKDREWLQRHAPPNVIIIDPPRSGMHEKSIKEVLNLKARRIVYVSCNPATQARDLKLLCKEDGYLIEEVQPVDMFPHTEHIECVAVLQRVG